VLVIGCHTYFLKFDSIISMFGMGLHQLRRNVMAASMRNYHK